MLNKTRKLSLKRPARIKKLIKAPIKWEHERGGMTNPWGNRKGTNQSQES